MNERHPIVAARKSLPLRVSSDSEGRGRGTTSCLTHWARTQSRACVSDICETAQMEKKIMRTHVRDNYMQCTLVQIQQIKQTCN